MGTISLNPDRFFDPDSTIRRTARLLYEETRLLPIVSPHGHVDPRWLAENAPFPEPSSLIVQPDHYILRMLYSQGISLELLGIPRVDGRAVEQDARVVWRIFAANRHLFHATPTGAWLDFELAEVFGVDDVLNAENADRVYDAVNEKLSSPEFLPRALFERFNIAVLATTDAAADTLDHHETLRRSGWKGRVIPTFRPDALCRITSPAWGGAVAALEAAAGRAIDSMDSFVAALAERRAYFRTFGATATDHGVVEPFTGQLTPAQANTVFERARAGNTISGDERRFTGHVLMEMARLSVNDGLVMQIHAGAMRDHNAPLFAQFGPDRGGDIPVATEFTRNLHAMLSAYGNDARFRTVLYTLDESAYARELAPLAGHYPAVRLGAAWWFHDSIEGMRRFRERTTETASIYNTAGFTDDTRAFCSIPARHDLARRVDANYLAGLVARHVIDIDDARAMARALAHDLAWETFRLGAS